MLNFAPGHSNRSGACFLKTNVEQAYDAVSRQFNSSSADASFFGTLPIYMLARQNTFIAFSKEIDGFTAQKDLLGFFMPSPSGFGHMAMWKPRTGKDDQATRAAEVKWAATLTHEFTHAFIARYRTIRGIPRWLNEGTAEVVKVSQFPYAGSIYPFVRDRDGKKPTLVGKILHDQGTLAGDDYPTCQTLVEYLQGARRGAFLPFFNDIKDGMEPEAALKKNYSFDYNGMERGWREAVGNAK